LWSLDSIPRNVDVDEGVMPMLALGVYGDARVAPFAPHLLDETRTPADALFAPYVMGAYTSMRLYYYLLGAGTQLFGFNIFGVRIADALIGIVCVALLFDGLRRVSNLTLATVAAFLLAASHAHIAYSRFGTGNIQTALTVALLFYLLCRVWSAPTFLNTSLFGVVVALSVQLYQTSLLAPLLLAAAVGLLIMVRPRRWRALMVSTAIFTLTCASAAAPFGVAVWKWGDLMLTRARDMGLFAPARMEAMKQAYQTDRETIVVAHQLFNALTVFQRGRDASTPYDVDAPMADRYTASLMIPGLVVAVLALRHVAAAAALVFTAGYLIIGLGGVYPIGYQRVTGALPLAPVIAALGLVTCADVLFAGRKRLLRAGRISLLVGLTALCAVASLKIYFVDHPPSTRHATPESEAGRIAARYAEGYRVHLVSWPRRASNAGEPLPGYEVQDVLAGDVAIRPLDQDPLAYARTVQPAGADLFILLSWDAKAIAALQRRFPAVRVERSGTEVAPGILTLVFLDAAKERRPRPPGVEARGAP
jgi:hypothetical protein